MFEKATKRASIASACLLFAAMVSTPAGAATSLVNVGSSGFAIHGFDPVAYFTEGRAIKGSLQHEYLWREAKWLFSTSANKELFATNPDRYAPQYGGYCAFCLAIDGEFTDANPKAWTIIDEKLYLNFNMYQRNQWRSRANVYVNLGDEEWSKVLPPPTAGVSVEGSGQIGSRRFQVAVLDPVYFYALGGAPTSDNLGHDMYIAILEQSSFEIRYADEPSDDTAEIFKGRDAPWPYPATRLRIEEVWDEGVGERKPNLNRVYTAGEKLGVDVVVMWFYERAWHRAQYPVTLYVVDVRNKRAYSKIGKSTEVNALVSELFSEFEQAHAAVPGYRVAVMKPAYWQPGSGSLNPVTVGDLGDDIYKSLEQQSSFSISHADEPDDPSALAHFGRGEPWPFPGTNVGPSEIWQGENMHKTPNYDRVYRAGKRLGVDAVVMWWYKPLYYMHEYPVELYVIDVELQQVYEQKGKNTNARAIVDQAFSEFLAGRRQASQSQ